MNLTESDAARYKLLLMDNSIKKIDESENDSVNNQKIRNFADSQISNESPMNNNELKSKISFL